MKKFNGVEQVGAADRNAGGYEMGKGGVAEMNRQLNRFLDDRGMRAGFRPAFTRNVKTISSEEQTPAEPAPAPAEETPAAAATEPASQPAPIPKKQYKPVIDPALAEIAPRIKAALVARGITQAQLSRTLGYKTTGSTCNAIAGYTYHAGVRHRICEALGLDDQGHPLPGATEATVASAPEPPPAALPPPPAPEPAPSVPLLPAFDLAAVASATAALNLTMLDYAFAQARYEEASRALRAARAAAEKIGITIHLPAETFP